MEEIEEAVLQSQSDGSVFQSDVVGRKELASKEETRKLEKTIERLSTMFLWLNVVLQ